MRGQRPVRAQTPPLRATGPGRSGERGGVPRPPMKIRQTEVFPFLLHSSPSRAGKERAPGPSVVPVGSPRSSPSSTLRDLTPSVPDSDLPFGAIPTRPRPFEWWSPELYPFLSSLLLSGPCPTPAGRLDLVHEAGLGPYV